MFNRNIIEAVGVIIMDGEKILSGSASRTRRTAG